jgi:acetyl esterase/lipase
MALLLLVCGVVAGAGPRTGDVVVERDLEFGKVGNVSLKLDLARPSKGNGPFPAVVCLHGGAWRQGHRSELLGTIRRLARKGYVAATVDYRLAPKYRWPAQIEDAKCAVRYLRSRAKELKIDPDRIASLGESAGAHLALLLGLLGPKDGLEGKGGHATFASKVKVVVNFFGPTDLRVWKPTVLGDLALRAATVGGVGGEQILRDFIGTIDRKAQVVTRISPVAYITRKSPPVLTLHGTMDPLVPIEQAKLLHQALKKAGVVEKLEVLENRMHGWGGKDRERTDRVMVEFLDAHLKKK